MNNTATAKKDIKLCRYLLDKYNKDAVEHKDEIINMYNDFNLDDQHQWFLSWIYTCVKRLTHKNLMIAGVTEESIESAIEEGYICMLFYNKAKNYNELQKSVRYKLLPKGEDMLFKLRSDWSIQ